MNDTETPPARSARRDELRRLMIATVDSAMPRPKNRGAVLGTITVALFLAGALTGGALVSSTSHHHVPTPAWWTSSAAREAVLQGISGGTLVGNPHLSVGIATARIALGTVPKGANALAVSLPCRTRGTGSILIDGKKLTPSRYSCARGNGAVSGLYQVTLPGKHQLTVTDHKGRPLTVMWSWTHVTKQSQEQLQAQLFELEQEARAVQQAYEQGAAACAAGALSGVPCSPPSLSPAP